MRKIALILTVAMTMVLMMAGTALAAHSTLGDRTLFTDSTVRHATYDKFTKYYPNGDVKTFGANDSLQCDACHAGATKHMAGPHGGYTNTTNRCVACHSVHAAKNSSLLPGTTVTDTCNFCHDLTGTAEGPYNATGIRATDIKAAHRVADFTYDGVDWINYISIPGGDSATGGAKDYTVTTTGLSKNKFTCDSCHTPHGGAAVNAYIGESDVKTTSRNIGSDIIIYKTNRLLKAKPNGVGTAVTDYGSAWCIACHAGRDDMGGVFNHPVNESGLAYSYQNTSVDVSHATYMYVDVDNNGNAGADTTTDPRTNRNYLMNTAGNGDDPILGAGTREDGSLVYATYAALGGDGKPIGPSCQQCHASARAVEKAFSGAGDPVRKTFPHMSTTPSLLIQQGDDFCTNCHQVNDLP